MKPNESLSLTSEYLCAPWAGDKQGEVLFLPLPSYIALNKSEESQRTDQSHHQLKQGCSMQPLAQALSYFNRGHYLSRLLQIPGAMLQMISGTIPNASRDKCVWEIGPLYSSAPAQARSEVVGVAMQVDWGLLWASI